MGKELEAIKARKAAMLGKLKELEAAERAAESAEKQKRAKADSRAKLLIGVAMIEAAKRSDEAMRCIAYSMEWLTAKDRQTVKESALWKELMAAKPPESTPEAPKRQNQAPAQGNTKQTPSSPQGFNFGAFDKQTA